MSHKGNNKRDISFVLQTSKELGHQKIELTKSKLLYNKRSISIVSKEASKSFVFNIDKKLNNAIEVEIPLYKGFKINEFVTERGYGFATYDAYLDSPENFNEFNNSNEYFGSLHNIETARIMENCDTGGIGAIACSIIDSFATISTGCTITCGSGYYACCKLSTETCNCIPIESSEGGGGTGGGSGGGSGGVSDCYIASVFVGKNGTVTMFIICNEH